MTIMIFLLIRGPAGDPRGDELLRGPVSDPHGDELLRGLVGYPRDDRLLRGPVGDPRGDELLRGLVDDPHVAEYLRGLVNDPHIADPRRGLVNDPPDEIINLTSKNPQEYLSVRFVCLLLFHLIYHSSSQGAALVEQDKKLCNQKQTLVSPDFGYITFGWIFSQSSCFSSLIIRKSSQEKW